jgi:hypothetical protein
MGYLVTAVRAMRGSRVDERAAFGAERRGSDVDDDPEEAARVQQYEFVWVLPYQYRLARFPGGFALEVVDFLGPGDPDWRGERTVWVRGPVVEASLRRAESVTVAVPHDQPRARRPGGAVLRPAIPGGDEMRPMWREPATGRTVIAAAAERGTST